jgi:hypothetical protein
MLFVRAVGFTLNQLGWGHVWCGWNRESNGFLEKLSDEKGAYLRVISVQKLVASAGAWTAFVIPCGTSPP